ncbi:MAG: hypothetical protein A3H96_00210 [Acidobacteria bacterium RIFCSPLOWO2_02_FULL_67_36]|nr:MAG: hypothetical protein A3H96_00210 [Acidobacteria bacterium RIFCSPLOWO2_02_FULL_67_36]OFW19612.1 MAG: hypothetical protein A3G21_21650 [Acidobacteria bacterium RIFCSPLOWO2_12_FULL_66_21]
MTREQRLFVTRFANTITAAEFEPGAAYSQETLRLLGDTGRVLGTRASIIGSDAWQGTPPSGRVDLPARLKAGRLRLAEYLLARTVVFAQDYDETTLPNCECNYASSGTWDCPAKDGYVKDGCGQSPRFGDRAFCRWIYDEYTGTCDIFKNHPCDGNCRYKPKGLLEEGPGDGDFDSNCTIHDGQMCPDSCDIGCWVIY